MYIRPKRFFWSVAILAALLYFGAHLSMRSAWVRAQVLRGVSAASGFDATASGVRLTPSLAFSFEDFRLESRGPDGTAFTVVSAKWLRLGRKCGSWRVRAVNAAFGARRGADGLWVPSRATGAEDCPGACVFPRISPAFGKVFFDIEDASFSFDSGDRRMSFAGVSWTRRRVCIPGRPGAVQNELSYLKGPMVADASAEVATAGRDEWYELGGEIARFAFNEKPAAQPVAAAPTAAPDVAPAAQEAVVPEATASVAAPAEPEAVPAEPEAAAPAETEAVAPAEKQVPQPAAEAAPEVLQESVEVPAAEEAAPADESAAPAADEPSAAEPAA